MTKTAFVTAVATAILAVDQLTKWYIRQTVPLYETIPVVSFFNITHVLNRGGAFSLLADASDAIRVPFFLLASIVAIGLLIYFLRHIPGQQRGLLFAVAGILGGALGNLVDRLTLGQVTDFLDLHWRGYHWPAFNVADSFISIGVVILVFHSILTTKQPQPRPDK